MCLNRSLLSKCILTLSRRLQQRPVIIITKKTLNVLSKKKCTLLKTNMLAYFCSNLWLNVRRTIKSWGDLYTRMIEAQLMKQKIIFFISFTGKPCCISFMSCKMSNACLDSRINLTMPPFINYFSSLPTLEIKCRTIAV